MSKKSYKIYCLYWFLFILDYLVLAILAATLRSVALQPAEIKKCFHILVNIYFDSSNQNNCGFGDDCIHKGLRL